MDAKDGSTAWAQSVLDQTVAGSVRLTLGAGSHCLNIFMVDAGVALDKVVIVAGALPPSYLGPPEAP